MFERENVFLLSSEHYFTITKIGENNLSQYNSDAILIVIN